MLRGLLIVVLAGFFIGCADTHKLARTSGIEVFELDPGEPIYVAVPDDGVYDQHTYNGSGQTTAQIIQAAFSRHARHVRVGRNAQSLKEAAGAARETGSEYLVYSRILHWEERATEWSGRPDRVQVKLEIVDVDTGKTVTSAVAKGKSGLATFGGDRPEDLLPKPIGEFVASLY